MQKKLCSHPPPLPFFPCLLVSEIGVIKNPSIERFSKLINIAIQNSNTLSRISLLFELNGFFYAALTKCRQTRIVRFINLI